jgi:hypothetical protein
VSSRVVRLLLLVVAAVAVHQALVRCGRRWGATEDELRQPLPGDELVPAPASQATQAVTIATSPAAVWPWLVQMGVDRAGLYTLLWVENGLLRLGVKNADRIVPEWQELKVGDVIAFTPEGYPGGRRGPMVAAIDPNRALVLCHGESVDACPGTWQFVLQDQQGQDDGATRLLMRSRSAVSRPLARKLFDAILEPGYLIMDLGMLRGIKARAERAAGT